MRFLGFVLALLAAGCANRSRIAQLYPDVAEHAGAEVGSIRFVGGDPFRADSLRVLIETQATHCDLLGLPLCLFGLGRQRHYLDPNAVVRDAGRLTVFFRREGFIGSRVTPRVAPEESGSDDVRVSFLIRRGDPVYLDTLSLEGIEGVLDSTATLRSLPLQPGDIFNLDKFNRSADQVLRELQRRGHAYAEVLRNYAADTITDRAVASIIAIPGPVVTVDSIIVTGAEELGRRTVVRQLGFRKGDVLRLPRLAAAQRNLYNFELVQIASVGLAPDSLQRSTDSTTATVLVAIAESNEYQARATIGFGTVECLRTDGDFIDRSFGGGGRRLRIDGSLSKIGIAGRTSTGLGGNLCSGGTADPVALDTIGSSLDYRLGLEITQPYFLSPRNQLSANIYTERASQPDFLREAVGTRLTVTHRLQPRTNLIGSIDVERGRTIAEPVLFCSAFLVCTPEDIEQVSGARFRNTVSLNLIQDRTDHPLDPTRGHTFRTGVAWAAPFLSSDVTFVRWTGELAMHRVLSPSFVGSASLRLGTFFQTASLNPARPEDDFLPPEERFYAGGANSVRGFGRNRLGPGVYVAHFFVTDSLGVRNPARREIENGDTTLVPCDDCVDFVPTGGTAVAVANLEVRMPSPFLPRRLRLAAFVDAGVVGHGNLWDTGGWRFTPGVGLRIGTPVGPARIDVAYNPYNPQPGTLFVVDREAGEIVQAQTDFTVPPPNFWQRLQFHVAIGQAF